MSHWGRFSLALFGAKENRPQWHFFTDFDKTALSILLILTRRISLRANFAYVLKQYGLILFYLSFN